MAKTTELLMIDLSNKKVPDIVADFNNGQGKKGSRIVQFVVIGGTPYLVIEETKGS